MLKWGTLEVSLHAASRTSAPLVHKHEFAGCRFAGALCSAACTVSACLPPVPALVSVGREGKWR
eukprot:543665-Lingulodinium_polyedra.AAC.1